MGAVSGSATSWRASSTSHSWKRRPQRVEGRQHGMSPVKASSSIRLRSPRSGSCGSWRTAPTTVTFFSLMRAIMGRVHFSPAVLPRPSGGRGALEAWMPKRPCQFINITTVCSSAVRSGSPGPLLCPIAVFHYALVDVPLTFSTCL